MRKSYEVTRGCNPKTQYWRGKLRGYAVTRGLYMCACACRCAGACVRVHVCVCDVLVTAKPRNSLGLARVCGLRGRVTS